jgi:putative salt-induced outer membrane protein YdiY
MQGEMKIKSVNGLRRSPSLLGVLCIILVGWSAQLTSAQTNSPPKWDVSAAAGLTLTKGNSDTVLFTLTGRGDKKWAANELHLGLDATYGETEDVKNNESLRGFAQYNRLFTERWYGYLRGDGLHDGIADIEYRFTIGPGVGYYFIKNPTTRFSLEGGPAAVFEKQGSDTHSYFTARIAEQFEHKFNDRVRIWEMLEFLPQVDRFENFIINGEVGVETALSKAWALRVVLQDTYDNEPAPGRDENDLKLIVAVAWKLIH